MIGRGNQSHRAIEGEMQRVVAAERERGELSFEGAARVGPARLHLGGDPGRARGEVHHVGARRPAEAQRRRLQGARLVAESLQVCLDLRFLGRHGRIEIDVRVDALELDPGVVDVGSRARRRRRRVRAGCRRACRRPSAVRGCRLRAGSGPACVSAKRRFMRSSIWPSRARFAVPRLARRFVEGPGLAGVSDGAAAAGRGAAQLAAEIAERGAEGRPWCRSRVRRC